MRQEIQLFQPSLTGLDQEVAQVELPGELWPVVEELAQRERAMFINYRPQDLNATYSYACAVDIDEYLQRQGAIAGQDATLELIRPYVKEALDLGYNYIILAA